MNFISQLKETESSKQYKESQHQLMFGSYEDMGFRLFDRIEINDEISLSIQCSYGHYCSPRKTLPVDKYECMELAIFKNNEFVSASEVIDNNVLIQKLDEYYEGTVYGYVPVDLLEGLYLNLINK